LYERRGGGSLPPERDGDGDRRRRSDATEEEEEVSGAKERFSAGSARCGVKAGRSRDGPG